MYLSYLSTEHDTSRYEKFASILCRCSLNVKISPDYIQDIHQLSLVFMYSLHLLTYFSNIIKPCFSINPQKLNYIFDSYLNIEERINVEFNPASVFDPPEQLFFVLSFHVHPLLLYFWIGCYILEFL